MEDMKINDKQQSLNECRESIQFHATNIANDCSSTTVNNGRINTLRILLDLFEEYNELMISQNGRS